MKLLTILIVLLTCSSTLWGFRDTETKMTPKEAKKLFALSDKIMTQISDYTGRKPNPTVKKALTSKKEVITYVKAQIKKQYKNDEFLTEEVMIKLLKIFPWKTDYKETLLKLLEGQVGGYFNPETNTMYLADWLGSMVQEITLAHELFHAVQHQNFGILKYLKMDNGNSDAKTAASAILEGEATGIMLDYMTVMKGGNKNASFVTMPGLTNMMKTQLESAMGSQNIPKPMLYTLVFPYIKGMIFVKHMVQTSGWEGMNKVYKRFPKSTEQLLHPEKYIADEKPVVVSIKDPKKLLPEVKLLGQNTLGEGTFNILFESDESKATAPEHAMGWGGDRIYAFQQGKQYFGIFKAVWDDQSQGKQFAQSLKKYFASFKGSKLILEKNGTDFTIVDATGNHNTLRLKGKQIVMLLNVTPELEKTLLKQSKRLF